MSAGCASSKPAAGLDSPLPAERMKTMHSTEAPADRARLRGLIEQLDSSDMSVRLQAITLLERETGETHGYRYDDPVSRRAAAVSRWVEWYAASEPRTGG